ncbi:MAG: T9SS type A sorting domain-containing protein [Paludibacter sp.]|nr:T9SS type A sorting domain-containing protein [Paludibacter sp.]
MYDLKFVTSVSRRNNSFFRFLGILVVMVGLSVSEGWGQLLQWNTFGNAGTETTEPSVFNDSHIYSANLTQGVITAAANGNRFGGSGWFNTGNTLAGNTLVEAITGNDYIQFIVTPYSSYSFTPTSFAFQWDKSETGPKSVTLRSSVDSYSSDLGTISTVAAMGTVNTITIEGLTNLTSATTFRIYGYGATTTAGTGGFDVSTNVVNVQLNGTVAAISSVSNPETFTVTTSSSSQINLTATANGNGDNIVVVTNGTGTFTQPTDGVEVGIVGDSFAGGNIVYKGSVAALPNHTGLNANTTYYYKAFSFDGSNNFSSGVVTNATTNNLSAPTATAATSPIAIGFTANWNAVDGASDYMLDVSTIIDFVGSSTTIAGWSFPTSGIILTPNNASTKNITKTLTNTAGTISDVSGATTQAPSISTWQSGSDTKYWQVDINSTGYNELTVSSKQRSSNTGPMDFKIQYKVGVDAWTDVIGGSITVANDFTTGVIDNLNLPTTCDNQNTISIRWIMKTNNSVVGTTVASGGTSRIDDILIIGKPEYRISGYNDLSVSGTSLFVMDNSSNNTFYYRVRTVGGNSTSANSNTITAIKALGLSIDASTLGDCPTCNIIVASGGNLNVNAYKTFNSVTVASGGKLTLADGFNLTAPVTMQSSALGTGTFVDARTNANPTPITGTVEQFLTGGRNWYISSPVASTATASEILSTSTATSKPSSLVWYDETKGSGTGVNSPWTQGSTEQLIATKGYIATNGSTASTNGIITFNGTLNTGDISTTIVNPLTLSSTGVKDGFNLVGNPYPSYLDWSKVTKTNLNSTMWYRTVEGSAYKFYTYNSLDGKGYDGEGIAVPAKVTKWIPPMQAFWVRVAGGTGSIGFLNSARGHNDITGNILKAPSARKSTRQLVRLQISNGTIEDETVIHFNPNASDNFDDFDSPKMMNGSTSTVPEIYTLAGSEQLVINGMNNIPLDTEIPLGFSTNQSPTNLFSLKASEINNFDANVHVILKDKLQNTESELTVGSEYSFSSEVVKTTNRFSLIFKTSSSVNGLNEHNDQDILVYRNENNLIAVSMKGEINGKGLITVFNSTGQKIATKLVTSTCTVVDNSYLPGVYIVQVKNGGKNIRTKVVIK